MGGVARGVFRDFRMARVSFVHLSLLQLEGTTFEVAAEAITCQVLIYMLYSSNSECMRLLERYLVTGLGGFRETFGGETDSIRRSQRGELLS
jgi:hypothetical protein